jgi:DNA-binding TFAR19-related protein (PDSD5 family)
MKNNKEKIVIYQAPSGALKVRLDKKSTVSILETVQTEGKRTVKRKIAYYNLDLILSIGYRVNSASATKFRQWATKTLRKHIVEGYTINKKRLAKNYEKFFHTVNDIKKLLPSGDALKAEDALELVKMFAATWFSLDAYDKSSLPETGANKKEIRITSKELAGSLAKLKQNLVNKGQATELFGQEQQKTVLQESWEMCSSLLLEKMLTKRWKKKQLTCYIFSSKIILL